MTKSRKNVYAVLGGLVLSLGSVAPAMADDSEIYLASTTATAAKPNILLIVDNSLSMNADDVTNERAPYNRSTTYGTSGNCTGSRIFYRKKGDAMPTCSSTQYLLDTGAASSVNQCDRLQRAVNPGTSTATSGRWTGKAAMWTSVDNSWADLRPGGVSDFVECQADDDVHGRYGSPTPAKYAQNGNASAKWTSLSTARINWSARSTYNFYSANYLNYLRTIPATDTVTRITSVRNAVTDLIASTDNVNMGLMWFNPSTSYNEAGVHGGQVVNRIRDIDAARADLTASMVAYTAQSATPLSETMFDAARYWQGGAPWANPLLGDMTARSGGNYISPIDHECQRNFQILLTDGRPTWDNEADSLIQSGSYIGRTCDGPDPGDDDASGDARDGRCLDDLTQWMYNTDMNTSVAGTQNVTTYTIGFGPDFRGTAGSTARDFLTDTAESAGGRLFLASNSEELQDIFDTITADALDVSTTFTSGSVSVNAFNRAFSRDEIYFSVFAPQDKYRWDGNVKKYKIAVVDTDGSGPIKPRFIFTGQGTPTDAVDSSTGFFRDSTRSFWSASNDGPNVTVGGAASNLPAYNARTIYTHLGASPAGGTTNSALISIDNSAVNDAKLGTNATNPTRADTLDFAKAREEKRMGDPMHNSPVVVTYGGTAASPIDVVYAATNDGYIHALDASTGVEKWAFVPDEMLGRLKTLMDNPTIGGRTSYGLDGDLRALIFDVDGDGKIETADGDKVYLYFGMRRGGKWYYGLDITDRDAPKLLFKIGPSDLPGVGETWAAPTITRVMVGTGTNQNAQRLVLVLAGGYAATQENYTQTDDTEGHRIFIVDAKSGYLLWSGGANTGATGSGLTATFANMKNSIPSSVVVQDINGDQFADRMYAADTGGRIWRFDIFNDQSAANLVTGGVFAALGQGGVASPTIANTRRFYYSPDVTLVTSRGADPYFNIAIGSGYRGHPLDKQTVDRFYSLRDKQPLKQLTQTEYNSLTAIPDSGTGSPVDITGANLTSTITASDVGWKMRFQATPLSGEKVISQATSGGDTVFFSTFRPVDPAGGATPCQSASKNRVYRVRLADGKPTADADNDGDVDQADVGIDVTFDGIIGQTNISLPPPELVKQYRDACVASGYKLDCSNKTDTDGDGDIDANDSVAIGGEDGGAGGGAGGSGLSGGGTMCNTGPIIHGACIDGNSEGRIYWFKQADTGN